MLIQQTNPIKSITDYQLGCVSCGFQIRSGSWTTPIANSIIVIVEDLVNSISSLYNTCTIYIYIYSRYFYNYNYIIAIYSWNPVHFHFFFNILFCCYLIWISPTSWSQRRFWSTTGLEHQYGGTCALDFLFKWFLWVYRGWSTTQL